MQARGLRWGSFTLCAAAILLAGVTLSPGGAAQASTCDVTVSSPAGADAGPPVCGNGITEPPCEQCDDGNDASCDGCSSTCQIERCGNGTVDCGEQCDDGNSTNGDGCENDCTLPACGNGILDAGEQCDDSNTNNCDGCSATCQFEGFCGDGVVDPNCEECDSGDKCTSDTGFANGECVPDGDGQQVSSCCSPTCQFESSDTVCRPSEGVCDATDRCTGDSDVCPQDRKRTGICRPAQGPCDAPDFCDGKGDDCPRDEFYGPKTVCRPAVDECDVEEHCGDRNRAACPRDLKAQDGTPCDDSSPLTFDDMCQDGTCVGLPRFSFTVGGTSASNVTHISPHTNVSGSLCAGRLTIDSFVAISGDVVATASDGIAVNFGGDCTVAGGVFTGGGTVFSEPPLVQTGAGIFTSGPLAASKVSDCSSEAMVAAEVAGRIEMADPTNPDPSHITVPRGTTLLKNVTPGMLNVFQLSRLVVGKDATLQLPGGNDPSTAVIINVTGVFRIARSGKIEATGGLLPNHVLINVAGMGVTATLKGEARLDGSLLALERDVMIGPRAMVDGVVASGGAAVNISSEAVVTGIQYNGPLP